jgi:hypothetical protein
MANCKLRKAFEASIKTWVVSILKAPSVSALPLAPTRHDGHFRLQGCPPLQTSPTRVGARCRFENAWNPSLGFVAHRERARFLLGAYIMGCVPERLSDRQLAGRPWRRTDARGFAPPCILTLRLKPPCLTRLSPGLAQ